MNGKDLLTGMSFVSSKYIEEAEIGMMERKDSGVTMRVTLKKSLMIAAIVAAMVLMMGCAVVYALKMQNMKVGDEEINVPVFDESYTEFMGYAAVPQQVLSMAGLKGSDSYQAAQEWYDFMQSYDPDRAIQKSVWGNYPDFPAEYAAYDPYSQEMVDKIDEIAAKYGLKLMGAPIELHGYKRFYQEMGIDSLLVPGSEAAIDLESASGYEGGSFRINLFTMQMPSGNGQWPYEMTNSMFYNKKDCFSTYTLSIGMEDWTEWNYTTTSGHNVLLMRSDGLGWIICDREDATIAIRISLSKEEGYNVDGRSWTETVCMTDRQFEMVADAFDFSIRPEYQGAVDSVDGVDPQSMVQTQNGYTVEVKSAVTDGQRAVIRLGITAPEGVSLTSLNVVGQEGEKARLESGGGEFFCKSGEVNPGWSSGTSYTEDDGDGKENTQDYVMEVLLDCSEELAFAPGSVWRLYWEDLQATYWNGDRDQWETAWTVEGTWIFDITFDEGDFRELELVREPVTTNIVTAWTMKGEDVYHDVTITSFVLRNLSATVTFEGNGGDLTDYQNEKYVTVVMEDGTEIRLQERNGTALDAEAPIDLDAVDYVLLTDGTKLYPVGPAG